MRALSGVPYVYDMDSSLAEQMVDTFPRLGFVSPALRRMEGLAVRRSLGVLDGVRRAGGRRAGARPRQAGRPGRGHDAARRRERWKAATRGRLPAAGSGPIAMYVGNLERYQGIDLLLEGFRHTAEGGARARSWSSSAAGQPDIAALPPRGRSGWGSPQSVIFMGPRPLASLAGLLRQADVLVSPRLKGLNTPMKIYSYLDSGSAVLATRLRTHTQVLHDRARLPGRARAGRAGPGTRPRCCATASSAPASPPAPRNTSSGSTRPQAARRKLDAFYDDDGSAGAAGSRREAAVALAHRCAPWPCWGSREWGSPWPT